MTDYVKRRMKGAMEDGADIAEEMADERDVPLPPDMVGQMGMAMFQTRMALVMSDLETVDCPDNTGLGVE